MIDGDRVRIYSPNGIDVTAKRRELTAIHEALHGDQAVLDGEMLALDEDGRFRFELLQAGEAPVTYLVFDILDLEGQDVIALPYEDRRRLLDQAVEPGPSWLLSPWQIGGGAALLEASRDQGLEGVMAKRLDSPYLPGRRSPTWRKIKNRSARSSSSAAGRAAPATAPGPSERCWSAITRATGCTSRAGWASGFDQRVLERLTRQLRGLRQDECPFDPECHPGPTPGTRRG